MEANEKYSRQALLKEIGEKQEFLSASTLAVIGLGALGTHCSELLARAGVENLILIDEDVIEESNLQRQSLYEEKDVGKSKVKVAKYKLEKINSRTKIITHEVFLDKDNTSILDTADLILDCTDNLETRFVINKYCKEKNKVWIFSSAVKTSGYCMAIFPEGPCLECFLENTELDSSCTLGVINTIINSISSLAATLAIKILTKQECPRELYHYNIWKPELKKLVVRKKKVCKACGKE